MKSTTYLSLVSFGVSASLALGPVALAGDCGQDPVYSKNLIGTPNVGLRVRDIACMEGSKVLTVVPAGTTVQIIGETDGWYKVKIGNTVGWMGSALMTVKGEGTAVAKNNIEKTETPEKAKAELGKKLMIGILERDFEKLKKDKALQARLKDKVVLRVQKRGETWYVEKDGVLTQVKMFGKNEFKRLNEDKKDALKAEKKIVPPEVKKEKSEVGYTKIESELILKATPLPGAVALEWTKRTSSGFQGYKVVRSETDTDLSYPKSGYIEYIADRDSRSFIDGTAVPGKTYLYRICALEKGASPFCGNVVKVVARQK